MYEVVSDIPMPDKKAAIEHGKSMVRDGTPRREVAIAIYDEYFCDKNVQPSTYRRRIRHLVGLIA